jgi:hypothetical protein
MSLALCSMLPAYLITLSDLELHQLGRKLRIPILLPLRMSVSMVMFFPSM